MSARRSRLSSTQAIKELGASEGALTSALGRLFALSEAYPDLKANQNMMQFQEELASTENKVAFSRQAFNDSVLQYNNSAQNFPNNVIAGFFSFELASFLEIESEEMRAAPEVSFT
jgi:LemA protein